MGGGQNMRGRSFNGKKPHHLFIKLQALTDPLIDRGGQSSRGNYNNDNNNYRRNDGGYEGGQSMRGGRNNFNGPHR